jgi:hypothetical protein
MQALGTTMARNFKCGVFVVFVIVLASAGVRAKSVTLVFKVDGPGGETYTLRFDTDRIPKQEMEKLAWLSPYFPSGYPGPFENSKSNDAGVIDKVFLAPGIGFRVDGDAEFFSGARAILERGQRELSLLNGMRHPEELNPVIRYLSGYLSFSLWLQRTLFRFYATRRVAVLGQKYGRFDPAVMCSDALAEIRSAGSSDEAYKLAWHDWYNCLLGCVSSSLGRYPMQAWRQFLKDYGIKETHELNPIPD